MLATPLHAGLYVNSFVDFVVLSLSWPTKGYINLRELLFTICV